MKFIKSVSIVKEAILEVNINEEVVEKAIKYGWDSLAFASNDTIFATVADYKNSYFITLETEGSACIYKREEGSEESIILKNDMIERDDEVMRDIENGEMCDNDKYLIDSSNWFITNLYKGDYDEDDVFYDNYATFKIDDIFRESPNTVKELADLLVNRYKKLVEYIEG